MRRPTAGSRTSPRPRGGAAGAERRGVRITSGGLRGRLVRTPAGEGTRPLLTRLRKALADVLRPRLPGAKVLDLFGGSGAIAFELLSNGAASAVICELDRAAAELVVRNARDLGLEDRVRVLPGDALAWIERLAGSGEVFDVLVVAPPYGLGLQDRALALLGAHPLAAPDAVIVVQRDAGEPGGEPPPGLELCRSRRHGRTLFDLYRPRAVSG
ncbi:MAG: RsmD family RNA methyltransferase [Deferrisomatales bacterium]|nr:RsmD family RNA methyltransferase [Deferrisomatales bacterium]